MNFRERACSDVGKFRRLICLLTLLSSLRSQPQRNVGWLHRVPYHTYQIVAQGLKVCSASQRDREGFQSLPCVVVPYHLFNNSFEEAHDRKGEMFGFPRLRTLIAEHGEERSLESFLLEELYSFVGEGWEQEDDITLLTLRRSISSS